MNAADAAGGVLTLPAHQRSIWAQLAIRVAIAAACIIITTAAVYLDRAGYRDVTGEPLSVLDALYYATVSLSTTGYGDITPVTESARLINILVITPLRVIFLIVLVGTTIEILTRRGTDTIREQNWKRKVKNHTVVIGYGVKGRTAVRSLLDAEEDGRSIVVITGSNAAAAEASEQGVITVEGDARNTDVLEQAMIDKAKKVIVAVDEDDATVLITLAVRRLSPKARIIAAAREGFNSALIKSSGADTVIPTAESSGRLLALASTDPHAGEFMEDLLDPNEGLEVRQYPVTREEIGLAPADLRKAGKIALAVVRDGQLHRFDDDDIRVFQKGDEIIAIAPSKRGKKASGNPAADGGHAGH